MTTKGIDCATPLTAREAKEIDIGGGFAALVDPEDFELLSQLKWHIHEKHNIKYARHTYYRSGKYGTCLMHRLVLNAPDNLIVDHINGDGLDNRKANLRLCTHSENLLNRSPRRGTSIYKGVYWHNKDRRWTATISKDGKRRRIGGFTSEIEAAKAYDKAAKELHGEFARLNFL